ncbi:YL1-domain-containing protein [Massarina eburnea CBS 473.64]|uniref:YL1-domain-containing protein n=1 Tax=Massarina eburnea CBS 473.64 TaxID=1395130 RepID=A0A6A6S4A4_9PLEO|nr:YL1-domain-containing protein [Massarina eburnea CBS 473.64]
MGGICVLCASPCLEEASTGSGGWPSRARNNRGPGRCGGCTYCCFMRTLPASRGEPGFQKLGRQVKGGMLWRLTSALSLSHTAARFQIYSGASSSAWKYRDRLTSRPAARDRACLRKRRVKRTRHAPTDARACLTKAPSQSPPAVTPAAMSAGESMAVDAHANSVSEGESEPDAPPDFMVVSRSRRSNAGNRMSTLIAQAAEEEQWGEEWEEAPNEEDFVGDEPNDQDDFNLDSDEEDEDEDDGGDDEDAGERELRKAERQERIKKRKAATNPFTARLAATSRKRVKLDVPEATESSAPTPRPKKKSERASWIPTEEDGPIRTSSRRQTVANKENTLAKLKEKDRRRDDTLTMMKAAEARKAKDQPKPLTQAERLAEAARVERRNSKSLHRWEEEEELRAADRQAKIDALKNRQIDGPFIRYYSGPAIWVDDKIKYTGKDAPSVESIEEKLIKETPPAAQPTQSATSEQSTLDSTPHIPHVVDPTQTSGPPPMASFPQQQPAAHASQHAVPISQVPVPVSAPSTTSHSVAYPNSITFAPPENADPFLYGMEHYARPPPEQPPSQQPPPFQVSQSELPPNPFLFNASLSQPHPSLNDPIFASDGTFPPTNLLSQFQKPPPPPRRKVIQRALRNLLTLSSFPNLESGAQSSRAKTSVSLKDKDRTALVQLSASLFSWSVADATTFVNSMLNAPKTKKERDALKMRKELCAVSNQEAKYRDPETGIAYRDSRAFGVLRGVVGGGFVWCGEAGCYVGGRAKPMMGMGKGFSGMPPVRGVPKRFLEMPKTVASAGPSQTPQVQAQGSPADTPAVANATPGDGGAVQPVKVEGSAPPPSNP